MAKAALSAQDAALIARIRTNRQARAALGIVAQYLRQGYDIAKTVPSFISPVDGTKMAAAQMRSTLDQDNNYARRVYATIPDDDAPVSDLVRQKIGLVLAQTRSTLAIVSTEANDLNRGLTGSLMDLINDWLKQLARDAEKDPLKALRWIGVGVAVLAGLYVIGSLVHTVTSFAGAESPQALLDAEKEAMEAARTRGFGRRRRSV